jgi:hypothetical protein
MISSKRRNEAYNEGLTACIETKGNCERTFNRFGRWNAQANAFNKGWNFVLKHKFLMRCSK